MSISITYAVSTGYGTTTSANRSVEVYVPHVVAVWSIVMVSYGFVIPSIRSRTYDAIGSCWNSIVTVPWSVNITPVVDVYKSCIVCKHTVSIMNV